MNMILFQENQISDVVQELLPLLDKASVVALHGPLGAGKTTLVRALLVRLGINEDAITSPTFSYVHQYLLPSGRQLFHFDLYRLSSLDEFYALGLSDYLYQANSVCFIEWPEVIASLLDHALLDIELDYGPEITQRVISWKLTR